MGAVDILVNNAAKYEIKDTIFTITSEEIGKTFEVNVKATMLMIKAYVKRYKERSGVYGRITNLSTDSAQAFAGQIAYGSSKAAIEAFTRSITIEIGGLGITINAVAPVPTQTGYIDEELEQIVLPLIPLGRLGQPVDIANTIVYLASKKAEWLTGHFS